MAADGKEDERAARADAERKETEDLLAGFDRPARPGRSRTPSQRDFVEYHLDRQRPSAAQPAPSPEDDRARRQLPTAIIPRKARPFASWLPWAAALAAMALAGILLARLASPPPPKTPAPSAAVPTTTPATTTTAPAATMSTPPSDVSSTSPFPSLTAAPSPPRASAAPRRPASIPPPASAPSAPSGTSSDDLIRSL